MFEQNVQQDRSGSSEAGRLPPLAVLVGALLVVEAGSFLLFAALHAGVPIGLTEPRIIPAAIVESLCGILGATAAAAVLGGRAWAWLAALTAQVIAIGGVLLGITTLALGLGPNSALNFVYHRAILALLGVGLIVTLSAPARRALNRR
jgi:hypothetical protein